VHCGLQVQRDWFTISGIRLAEGNVILVGSVSDLGVIGYAEELNRTIRIVKEKQGGKVQVSALPTRSVGGHKQL
jgi:hypothetical protein